MLSVLLFLLTILIFFQMTNSWPEYSTRKFEVNDKSRISNMYLGFDKDIGSTYLMIPLAALLHNKKKVNSLFENSTFNQEEKECINNDKKILYKNLVKSCIPKGNDDIEKERLNIINKKKNELHRPNNDVIFNVYNVTFEGLRETQEEKLKNEKNEIENNTKKLLKNELAKDIEETSVEEAASKTLNNSEFGINVGNFLVKYMKDGNLIVEPKNSVQADDSNNNSHRTLMKHNKIMDNQITNTSDISSMYQMDFPKLDKSSNSEVKPTTKAEPNEVPQLKCDLVRNSKNLTELEKDINFAKVLQEWVLDNENINSPKISSNHGFQLVQDKKVISINDEPYKNPGSGKECLTSEELPTALWEIYPMHIDNKSNSGLRM